METGGRETGKGKVALGRRRASKAGSTRCTDFDQRKSRKVTACWFTTAALDNQHKATWKFGRRWFGPYAGTSANDNGTYHLAELDGTRIVVPVDGKRIKASKKRHEGEPDDDVLRL